MIHILIVSYIWARHFQRRQFTKADFIFFVTLLRKSFIRVEGLLIDEPKGRLGHEAFIAILLSLLSLIKWSFLYACPLHSHWLFLGFAHLWNLTCWCKFAYCLCRCKLWNSPFVKNIFTTAVPTVNYCPKCNCTSIDYSFCISETSSISGTSRLTFVLVASSLGTKLFAFLLFKHSNFLII